MIKEKLEEKVENHCKNMRNNAIELIYSVGSKGAHVGPGLSAIEILGTLYCGVMKNGLNDKRDRFILSKGHGTIAYYTALHEVGYISKEELDTFEHNNSFFSGQPSRNEKFGIEVSSGSLGHGLSLSIGIALAAKKQHKEFRTFVLMGDGECNEGTVWESAMFASHLKLNNIVAIIDKNNLQSDGKCSEIFDMGDMAEKWKAFGWETLIVDGHNVSELLNAFNTISNKPIVIIANTIKGKGVSFCENNPMWHHGRFTEEQYLQAKEEQRNHNGNR